MKDLKEKLTKNEANFRKMSRRITHCGGIDTRDYRMAATKRI